MIDRSGTQSVAACSRFPPAEACRRAGRCPRHHHLDKVILVEAMLAERPPPPVICPKCKAEMDEVARIAPLSRASELVAYQCSSCRYTTSEILPATARKD